MGTRTRQMRPDFFVVALAAALSLAAPCPRCLPAEGSAGTEGTTIRLAVGRSEVIRAPWLVKRISVADPEVADVQALAPDKVLVLGKGAGSTDVFLWNEAEDVWHGEVVVAIELAELEKTLARSFEGSDIHLEMAGDALLVSGTVRRAEQIQQVQKILEAAGARFVDISRLAGVQQVQIQVRVAEVSRTALRALGFNAFYIGESFIGGLNIGPSSGGAINPLTLGVPGGTPAVPGVPFAFNNAMNVSPLVTMFGALPNQDLAFFIQALSENQYLKILAEPSLVAMSGEEASFLAGGEFPIPIVQGGTANSTSITIEYKEFGVRLNFRPVVMGESRIRLNVAPEVSDITDSGAIEIQGFRIPSIITRRASTTLELQSGQTFAMAGLLSSRKTARNSRVPLLGDIPVLGALFRSVRYEKGETELVVLATATLVEPLSTSRPPFAPGDLELFENDWQIFLNGQIWGNMPEPPPDSAPDVFRELKLEGLRGPGAWTDHQKGVARGHGRVASPRTAGGAPAPSEPAAGSEKSPAGGEESGAAPPGDVAPAQGG